MIEKRIEKEKDLTIHTATGKMTIDELQKAVKSFYENPTIDTLWDFTDADLSSLKSDDIRQIAVFTRGFASLRKNGKTALVSPKDVTFGISRMYETLTNLLGHDIEVSVFRTLEEAYEWLKG